MMGLVWYLIGLSAGGAVLFLVGLARKRQLSWLVLAGLAAGIGLVLFCVAWSMGSALEGVPRAAAMGIVCFGLPGIVLLAVAGRKGIGS
jgi:uncharacterized membrane protein